VLGTPNNPKSCVVFAPRGGGKTAQRRYVELDAERSGRYLTVLYATFPLRSGESPSDLTLERHLDEVCRRLTMSLLLRIDLDDSLVFNLNDNERAHLLDECARFESLTRDDFETIIGSCKTFGDKTKDWLSDHSGPIKTVVSAMLQKYDIALDPTSLGPVVGPRRPVVHRRDWSTWRPSR
jgi:hypothetical protein